MLFIADLNLVKTWKQNVFQNENEYIASFVFFTSFFSHSLLSCTPKWRQFTTWHLLLDFVSLGRTFSQSVGNVENDWKGDFLFSFLVLADLRAWGFKMRVKTTYKWKSRFPVELVSMPAPRHTRDSLCDTKCVTDLSTCVSCVIWIISRWLAKISVGRVKYFTAQSWRDTETLPFE